MHGYQEAVRILITDESGMRLLLAKRAANDYRGGTWVSLGGKIDPGESPEEAIIRETFEEAGLTLSGLRLFNIHRSQNWKTYFFTGTADGDLVLDLLENSEVGYFAEEELSGMELAFDHLDVYVDFLRSRA